MYPLLGTDKDGGDQLHNCSGVKINLLCEELEQDAFSFGFACCPWETCANNRHIKHQSSLVAFGQRFLLVPGSLKDPNLKCFKMVPVHIEREAIYTCRSGLVTVTTKL